MNNIIDDIKTNLININLCVDNDYLDKYVNLISNRKIQEKLELNHFTQSHHIIPVMYYKHENISIDNTTSNRVVLKPSEHIIAHWYLSNCSLPDYFKYGNLIAVNFLENVLHVSIEEFIQSEEEQDLYNSRMAELSAHKSEVMRGEGNPHSGVHTNYGGSSKGYKFTSEQRDNLSRKLKGKPSNRRGCKLTVKQINALTEGGRKYRASLTPQELQELCDKQWATRRATGKTHTTNGMHIYNNGVVETRALECPDGFVPGRLEEYNKKTSDSLKRYAATKTPEQIEKENKKRLATYSSRTTEQKQREHDLKSVASRSTWNNKTVEEKLEWAQNSSNRMKDLHSKLTPEEKALRNKRNSEGQKGKVRYVCVETGRHRMFSPGEQPDGWVIVEYVHCWNKKLNKRVRIAKENFDSAIHCNIEESTNES